MRSARVELRTPNGEYFYVVVYGDDHHQCRVLAEQQYSHCRVVSVTPL